MESKGKIKEERRERRKSFAYRATRDLLMQSVPCVGDEGIEASLLSKRVHVFSSATSGPFCFYVKI